MTPHGTKHTVNDSRMVCEWEECPFDEGSVAMQVHKRLLSLRNEQQLSADDLKGDIRGLVWAQAAKMATQVLEEFPEGFER